MTPYTERRVAGCYEADGSEPGHKPGRPQPQQTETGNGNDADQLPGRHTALDQLALEQGHEWSSDDLTVAQKREELAAL